MQHARVAMIGSEAKEKFFSGRNALGEHIRLDGLSFEVIGVLGPKMQEGDSDINRHHLRSLHHHERPQGYALSGFIWFTYQTPEYERLEQTVRVRAGGAAQVQSRQTARR